MAAANSSTATKAKSDEKSTSSRRKNVPKLRLIRRRYGSVRLKMSMNTKTELHLKLQ